MGGFKKLVIPAIAAAVGLAILLNLGFWQLNRLEWKTDLIAQVEDGIGRAPVPAPGPNAWPTLGESDDYLHVVLEGSFLDGNAFYYTALSDPAGPFGGPGVMVYAPFRTAEGWTVFVNRGFLPQELAGEPRQQALNVPEGNAQVTGLLRLSEKPNWTTPEAECDRQVVVCTRYRRNGRGSGSRRSKSCPLQRRSECGRDTGNRLAAGRRNPGPLQE